jgi:hypothetical protein
VLDNNLAGDVVLILIFQHVDCAQDHADQTAFIKQAHKPRSVAAPSSSQAAKASPIPKKTTPTPASASADPTPVIVVEDRRPGMNASLSRWHSTRCLFHSHTHTHTHTHTHHTHTHHTHTHTTHTHTHAHTHSLTHSCARVQGFDWPTFAFLSALVVYILSNLR